jgi:hypothetical protein
MPVETTQPAQAVPLDHPSDRDALSGGVTYEQTTPWYAQRRTFRLIVLLMVLNIIAVTSITWGPITAKLVQDRLAERKAAEAQAQAAALQVQTDAANAAAHQAAVADRAARVQQCLTYSLQPGQVIYTESFVAAAQLILNGKAGYVTIRPEVSNYSPSIVGLPHPPVRAGAPLELQKAVAALHTDATQPLPPSGTRAADGTLFLHERKTPSGRSRVVWIQVDATRLGNRAVLGNGHYAIMGVQRQLNMSVADPAAADQPGKTIWTHRLDITQQPEQRVTVVDTPASDSKLLRGAIEREGESLWLMAGTADPADASRLTVPYQLDEMKGVIEVRLEDDDRLRVKTDRGVKSLNSFDRSNGRETWDPRAEQPKSTHPQ